MTWARLDDAFPDHPKVVGLSDKAFRVHTTAICYCARLLTDGEIRQGAEVRMGATPKVVKELVASGVWDEVDGGWMVHDYLTYNPTKEKVLAEREATKRRVNGWRNAHGNAVTDDVTSGVSNGVSNTAPVPVPQSLSNESEGTRPKRRTLVDDAFRERMVKQYAAFPEADVLSAIDDAVGYQTYSKWTDKQRYVMRWLRNEFEKKAPSPKNGGVKTPQGQDFTVAI